MPASAASEAGRGAAVPGASAEPVIWDRAETLPRERLELLRERAGLRITVTVTQPGTIPRSEGMAVRVVDRRPVTAG
jgi:phenylacetate-coenzyme A ligase PaaK-like adenylate-forming protein